MTQRQQITLKFLRVEPITTYQRWEYSYQTIRYILALDYYPNLTQILKLTKVVDMLKSFTNFSSASSRKLIRQPLIIMILLMFFGFIITLGMIFFIASDLNSISDTEDSVLIRKLIQNQQDDISSHLTDNAVWGGSYKNLHEKVNLNWAWEQQNLGASLYKDFGYNGIFVINPAGKTVYSIINGKLSTDSIQQWMETDPTPAILHQLRKSNGSASTQFMMVKGKPVLVSAAWITPGSDNTIKNVSEQHSILLFVVNMTDAKLIKLGADYTINNLHYEESETPYDGAKNMIPLSEFGARGILTWQSENPGKQLIVLLLPITVVIYLGMLFAAIMQLKHIIKIVQSSDENIFMLQQSQLALLASEKRFRDVAETSTDWIWEADNNLAFNWISSRFSAITGYSSNIWIHRTLQDFLFNGNSLLNSLEDKLKPGEYTHLSRCRYLSAQQYIRYCDLTIRRIELANGRQGFRGTVTDVTLEVEAEEKAKYLALHDDLTGLPNRTQMKQFLTGELEIHHTCDNPLAVIMVDLDKFKPVNDIYGHAMGDAVLHEVSLRFRHCVDDVGFTARLGGDEFVIIVPAMDTEEISNLCDKIIEKINTPFHINGTEISIGVSMGIATTPKDADNITDILRYSDFALYKAKNNGGNKYEFYHTELTDKIVQRREMESELREAIRSGQLAVVYQPRLNMKLAKVTAVEALVRWNHPVRGLVMPDQFISLAEETGLIKEITDWVIERACFDMQSCFDQMKVSVNISALEFSDRGLTERITRILEKTGFASHRLEIEITENALVKNPDDALKTMRELHKLGINFHVDDFGTGYASFGYLSNFPFNGLKLDKSFILAMHESDNALKIVENLISLGKAYSLVITAEGVETLQQKEQLQKFNCDVLQGYLIGQPIQITQLTETYQEHVLA
ncbi:diguanylate cyclase (plasmid) [Pantoea phytobeneficialis]|uniref:diguanylate cyclase n=2 Tax=Pantoea phytobeneficialis TaxID=2052056 RepID=A0AAP9H9U3_9GAMM|nr:diguanylate cyclase [Pantoea phytobeneficialis]